MEQEGIWRQKACSGGCDRPPCGDVFISISLQIIPNTQKQRSRCNGYSLPALAVPQMRGSFWKPDPKRPRAGGLTAR